MSDAVQIYLDTLTPMLTAVDEILDAWDDKGCYQVPILIGNLAVRFNWNAKEARRNDPIIRSYLKVHPVWYITRGAYGGIMRREEHNKKEAEAEAKKLAKLELQAALKVKEDLARALLSSVPVVTGQDNTNTVSE